MDYNVLVSDKSIFWHQLCFMIHREGGVILIGNSSFFLIKISKKSLDKWKGMVYIALVLAVMATRIHIS